jgi:5-methylcytosine-specific restriction protein A
MSLVEAPARFVIGRVYGRSALLDEYGGQRYGGIATPRDSPVILIFTGASGLSFGYQDEWDADGVFHYYGEGQTGDMKFSGGNAAIRDHAANEKELHLFERIETGRVRYIGEVLCSGFKWGRGKDKVGVDRRVIMFQLVPATSLEASDLDLLEGSPDLADLAAEADADATEESAPKEGIRRTYARSQALKSYVRARASGSCEACGNDAPFLTKDGSAYLEAHHTNRLSDTGPGNRTTVIALCPNCHSRVHYGKDGNLFNEKLKGKLLLLES